MDKKSAYFSNKHTNMAYRSKIAFYESMDKSTEESKSTTNEDGGIPDFSAMKDVEEPSFGTTNTTQPRPFGTGSNTFCQPAATGTGFGGFRTYQAPSFGTTKTTQPRPFSTGTNTSGQPAATGTGFGGFRTYQAVSTNQTGGVKSNNGLSDIVLEDTFEPSFGTTKTTQPMPFSTRTNTFDQPAATGSGFGGFGTYQASSFGTTTTTQPRPFSTATDTFRHPDAAGTGLGEFRTSQAPALKKTEILRREYHQEQTAQDIKWDGESTLQNSSPGKIKSFNLKCGSESNYTLREKKLQVSSSLTCKWSLNDLEIFQHPMCMISAVSEKNEIGEETKIQLRSEEKVFDQIAKIDWPMVVVAVAGLYRTGKSYLMNRLANSSKGFTLGDTIESTTKGIWAWCKIHPTRSNTVLLLLDTEGLGDVEKGDPRYDNKIFTLATLLCNCLIYNMKGAFDNDAVSKLTFVTEMASNIRFRGKSSEDNRAINQILPDFVLCLRDFSLKLIKDGRKITENEYLEQSLAENKNKGDQFNKPRACIRKYFKRRACFAFPVPGDGDVLENLETLSFNQLSTRFKEVTSRFASFIYKIPPKTLLTSKAINGQMFVTLADRYVRAIKNGAVPDVDDAFTAVAKIENAKVETEALDIFENEIQNVKLPVSESDLENRYTKAQNIALHHLRQNVVHDFQAECRIQAQRKMDAIWNKIKTTNEQKVREKCEDTLQKVFVKYLEKNLKSGKYETAGGHRRYKRDVESIKYEYVTVLRDFKENEIISTWYGFLETMSKTEGKIIEADENMSQREKEAEQKQNQEKLEELLEQQQRVLEDAFDKQKTKLEDHYEKLENDLREQLEAEKEKYEEFLDEMKNSDTDSEDEEEAERYRIEHEAAKREAARYKKEQAEANKEVMRLKAKEEKRKKQWFGARVWNAFLNR